jgi:UDP-N-acetylglucosamine--dolichyl-phosphate N-acetylglucosaminephosphotransferase
MVVANLVNMHSGYNGLQSGASVIIISTLCIKSHIDGSLGQILPAASILGAVVAFWFFNKYPSKVFEGNIGSLMFGSTIGCIIVLQQYWWFGFFILIPHTFNFLLWMIWLIKMYRNPEEYLINGSHKKFGKVNESGIIIVPNCLTLKWIPNYYYELNERNSVYLVQSITLLFCIMGLLIF